jgi:hypothetical protein
MTETEGADTHRSVQKPSLAVQKGQTFHPPNPGAPRHAVPRARPQQATKDRSSKLARSRYPKDGPEGNSRTVLHCAHRTSTVSSCAFCKQEGWSGCSPLTLLRPRVARAQETHRAIPPPAGGLCQQPARGLACSLGLSCLCGLSGSLVDGGRG